MSTLLHGIAWGAAWIAYQVVVMLNTVPEPKKLSEGIY